MLKKIQNALKKYNKKVWVMYNNENSDRIFSKYLSKNLATHTICFITPNLAYIIVSELDSKNLEKLKYNNKKVRILVFRDMEELNQIIEEIIAKLQFVDEICLSYSTMSDKNADILTHGDYIYLTELLKRPYEKYAKKVKFTSAEQVIYDIESQRTPLELERLKNIAYLTNKILEETFSVLKKGMSEIEIVKLTAKITERIMNKYKSKYDILYFDMAWENCPIVLLGENLKNGGHSLPSQKCLEAGNTIYFDFGLEVEFNDHMVLYTDIQRMGYALKETEKKPPVKVQKVFDTLVQAIEDGVEALKKDVKAYKIDNIVREKIRFAGYPDYNHATGHAVGLHVHDVGAVITTKSSKRANLELIENGVYTLEPRIAIANGGSIEEMIQVTKFGGVPISPMQKEIYLVK